MLSCKTQQEGKQFRKNAANSTAINSIWWPYLVKSKTEKGFVPLLPIVYIFYGIWSQFIEIATLAVLHQHHIVAESIAGITLPLTLVTFFRADPSVQQQNREGRQAAFILCCNDWLFSAFYCHCIKTETWPSYCLKLRKRLLCVYSVRGVNFHLWRLNFQLLQQPQSLLIYAVISWKLSM